MVVPDCLNRDLLFKLFVFVFVKPYNPVFLEGFRERLFEQGLSIHRHQSIKLGTVGAQLWVLLFV